MSEEKLWVFAKPDQMIGHKFTDDVAITYASDKGEAIKKISRLYSNIEDKDVRQVYFNAYGVAILTDY
jgi:hypothetical protein